VLERVADLVDRLGAVVLDHVLFFDYVCFFRGHGRAYFAGRFSSSTISPSNSMIIGTWSMGKSITHGMGCLTYRQM